MSKQSKIVLCNFSVDVRESMCENGAEIKNFENTLLMEVEDINARQKVIDELKEVQGLFQKNVKFQDKMTMKQKWAKVKNELKPKFDKFEKEYNAAVKNVKSVENNLEIKENALASKYFFTIAFLFHETFVFTIQIFLAKFNFLVIQSIIIFLIF